MDIREKNQIHPYLLAAALYTALSLLYFYPCLGSFTTALIGPPEDNMIFLWDIWYGAKALITPGWELMYTRQIYYPEGTSLFLNNYFYTGVFLNTALQFLMNPVTSYNLLILTSFILSALSAFALIKYLTKNTPAGLIGGFVFGFCPQHFGRSMHHAHLATMQFIPLYVLFFIRSIRGGGKKDHVLAALSLILVSLTSWNYMVFCLIFTVLACLWMAITQRSLFWKKNLIKVIIILTTAFAGLAYWIIPMIIESTQLPEAGLEGHDVYVANLLGFLVPHPYHALADWDVFRAIRGTYEGNPWERIAYLGWVNIVLLVLARGVLWKERKKYLAGLGIFMILAMGVSLHVYSWRIPMIMPYDLLRELPIVSFARNPGRMIVFAYLFLAILVAFSVKKIFFTHPMRPKKKMVFGLVCLLIFLDYYSVCAVTTPIKPPPAYRAIQEDPDQDFGILEIPWEGGRHLMYQVTHKRPTVQGYIGRRVGRSLVNRMTFDVKKLLEQRALLIENKVKYIVIHKRILWKKDKYFDSQTPMTPEEVSLAKVFTGMANIYGTLYQKVYEDENSATFRVY